MAANLSRKWLMRLELQVWVEPRTWLLGFTVQSARWLVIYIGPICLGVGRHN